MQSHLKVTLLAGGIGGSRLAVGFDALPDVDLTIIGNVGDDDEILGMYVSPDLDTLCYTLAGVEGPLGWGRADESWRAMDELEKLGGDVTFRLGDVDLATNIFRTTRLASGASLSQVTSEIAARHGISANLIPASDNRIRTRVETADGDELDFQTYFVRRGHRDPVAAVFYAGVDTATPAPGVVDALLGADLVVIAPSNPVLSILPITEIAGIGNIFEKLERVVAVSPLVEGKAVKGPTAELLTALGFSATHTGVLDVYRGIVTDLVTDSPIPSGAVRNLVTDTLIAERHQAGRLAKEIISWVS